MMPKLTPSGIKPRLLALMLLVLLPIALASVMFASRNYSQQLAMIEDARAQIANDFAIRTRVWFRGAVRTASSIHASVHIFGGSEAQCSDFADATIESNPGYSAILLTLADGRRCIGRRDLSPPKEALAALASAMETRPALRGFAGPEFNPARYGSLRHNDQRYVVVHVTAGRSDRPETVLLVADAELLDSTFDIGPLENVAIGLIDRSNGLLVAARGETVTDGTWLPAAKFTTTPYLRHDGLSQAGEQANYALASIADSDLQVVARFTNVHQRNAWTQYLVMALTPLVAALFLFAVYVITLQRDVIRWIMGLGRAARARLANPQSQQLAPVGPDMPRELRSVALTLNSLLNESHVREAALKTSLDENRHLMRELHHRVKNSLQVIQSYLSLAQRSMGRRQRAELAETEARVLVLSISYRLALTDGGMRPVFLRPLAEEIVANLAASIRRDDQWVTLIADVDAQLDVDRAIPFGLAIVEGVISGLRASGCEAVTAAVTDVPDAPGSFDLRISTSDNACKPQPPARIMQGLALQLQAQPAPPRDGDIIAWRFHA